MTQEPRVLVFDLESSDLNADVGFLICMAYRWLGQRRVNVLRIDQFVGYRRDTTDDGQLVGACRDVLASADMLVSWYGREGCFDAPFLRTRMLRHGVPPLPPLIHWDGQQMSRKYLRMRANRLVNMGRLLKVDMKTDFDGPTWMRAVAGHRKSLDYLVTHCRKDVDQLTDVYLRMRPYMPTHPNLNVIALKEGDVCPVCLGRNLRSNGYRFKAAYRSRRYLCLDCGKWSYKGVNVGGKAEVRS
jgi:uncharacterized protein YprB with RNaseH-like and TPR domain